MAQSRIELEPHDGDASAGHLGFGSGLRRSNTGYRGLVLLQRSPQRMLIDATVAQVFGVHARDLQGLSRGRARVAQARQVTMYLAHVVFRLSLSDTGRLFDRDRTTVAHACCVIEDMRDDGVFDRILDLLEGIVLVLVRPRNPRVALCN